MRRSSRTALALAAILALEVAVFAPHFRQFYCGDSVYWFSRILEDESDLVARFKNLDDLGQYRPLTFAFSSWIVWPLAGLDLFRNHVFPILFHALNTVLVFLLGRRLLSSDEKALVAAFVFGVSTVAAYVTYDNTFIPDYLYAFFYLASLLALGRGVDGRAVASFCAAFLLFLAALFCKEAAITYPAAALVVLWLAGLSPRRSATRVVPFAAVSVAYLGLHLVLKGGRLYPADPNQPHHLEVGLTTLRAKLPMIGQALGLPVHLPLEPVWLKPLLLAFLTPVLAWTLFCTLRGIARRERVYSGSLVWFAATLAPALFVVAPTWEHNLYVPLVGFSWIVAESLRERVAARGVLPALALVVFLATAAAQGAAVRRSSWMAAGSRVTAQCLADLRQMRPQIAPNTLLYVESRREGNIAWHFDSGRLAASFYRDPSIRMRFAGDGRPAPGARMLATGKVIVVKYIDGRLYDVTARRRLESVDRRTYRVLEHWSEGRGEAAAVEPPVVFPYELGLEESGRDTLALVPGATYSHRLPPIAAGSRLRFGVALASGRGTGLVAQTRLKGPSGATVLERAIRPQPVRWHDENLDLGATEGRGFTLEVSARAEGAGTDDWLEWGPLDVVPPESQKLALPPPVEPPQPSGIRISPSPMKRGGWATIEVFGGSEMEVDCQYLLEGEMSRPRTVASWLSTDAAGLERLQVNRPGRYVITAIRNALRSDWVPIRYEWACVP